MAPAWCPALCIWGGIPDLTWHGPMSECPSHPLIQPNAVPDVRGFTRGNEFGHAVLVRVDALACSLHRSGSLHSRTMHCLGKICSSEHNGQLLISHALHLVANKHIPELVRGSRGSGLSRTPRHRCVLAPRLGVWADERMKLYSVALEAQPHLAYVPRKR